eukprot:945759-Pleurochrysis_carterae.AAC.4
MPPTLPHHLQGVQLALLLLFRAISANRRGGAAWQALIPYSHAPAIYCKALPLLLQPAVAATMFARTVSVVCGKGILL